MSTKVDEEEQMSDQFKNIRKIDNTTRETYSNKISFVKPFLYLLILFAFTSVWFFYPEKTETSPSDSAIIVILDEADQSDCILVILDEMNQNDQTLHKQLKNVNQFVEQMEALDQEAVKLTREIEELTAQLGLAELAAALLTIF